MKKNLWAVSAWRERARALASMVAAWASSNQSGPCGSNGPARSLNPNDFPVIQLLSSVPTSKNTNTQSSRSLKISTCPCGR
jgi:hypothetical protein